MALRFRVAGFPVQVHPLFFLTTLATGATGGWNPARLAVWFGVVFVSVLVHELGHALAFRRYGHGASISLHGLGGTATSTGGRRLTHRQELWLSLAGPGAGFLLGGLVLVLQLLTPVGQAGGWVGYAVRALLWANFGYGLLNLLPIVPLDGGHAMAALIRERKGNRFEWLVHGISLAAAVVLLVLAIVWKQLWLGGFALVLAVLNVGRFAQTWMERVYALGIRAASKRMRATYEKTAEKTAPPKPPAPPPVRLEAPPQRPPDFEQDLPELPPDPQFLGEWLLGNGLPELALQPLRAAFATEPSPQTGHALATALLETGRHTEIAGLLSSPSGAHLGDETLTLIAARSEAAGQLPLATRARELHQRRASARTPRA
ncbi:MAG TPA: site-2 protease family protein [Hyalangium sp.]|nr:site-2 protease family protein [Hyalangium sp.]